MRLAPAPLQPSPACSHTLFLGHTQRPLTSSACLPPAHSCRPALDPPPLSPARSYMFFLGHHSGFIYNRLSEDQERVDIQLTKSARGGARAWPACLARHPAHCV